jgi:hypothetical protein
MGIWWLKIIREMLIRGRALYMGHIFFRFKGIRSWRDELIDKDFQVLTNKLKQER